MGTLFGVWGGGAAWGRSGGGLFEHAGKPAALEAYGDLDIPVGAGSWGGPRAGGTLSSSPSEDLTLVAHKNGRTAGLGRDLS